MADRGTNNSPNTRNPDQPPSKPGRLDQFADDLNETPNPALAGDVTSNDEAQELQNRFTGP